MGLGHLRRCSVLATALRHSGFAIRAVRSGRDDEALAPGFFGLPTDWIMRSGVNHAGAGAGRAEGEDADAMLALVGRGGGVHDWVVVDHYQLQDAWERRVRDAGYRVLAIDDFRSRRHCADLLVSDTPTPFPREVDACATGGTQLVGFPYALIDEQYAATGSTPPEGSVESPGVLITYGGSDPTMETAKALEALMALRLGSAPAGFGAVNVVVGPANPKAAALERMVGGLAGVMVHRAPESLAPLMRTAQLVVTSGGNSVVEALALRRPCVVTVTSENQRLMVEELAARDLIMVAGDHQVVDARRIGATLEAAVRDLPSFTQRVRDSTPFDHLGASRIVAAMRDAEERRQS